MKYRRKPRPIVDAVQFHAGMDPLPTSVVKRTAEIVWSRDRRHFYVHVPDRRGLTVRGAWLPIHGPDHEALPFAFWDVKSGDREPCTREHELFRRYAKAMKWPEDIKDVVYVIEFDGRATEIRDGDWIVDGDDGARFLYTAEKFAEDFEPL